MTTVIYSGPIFKSVLPDQIFFKDVGSDIMDRTSVIGMFDKQGNQIGDLLTDLAYEEDFNRYHDIYHYAKDQILQYSPTVQSLLGECVAPRDTDADETSIAIIQNAFKEGRAEFDYHMELAYTIIYGHHKEKPHQKIFNQVMSNAHNVFTEVAEIKKANPEPIEIMVGYNEQKNKIEAKGFLPL